MSVRKFWLWLCLLPGLHNQTRLSLLEHFVSPEDLYYADPEEIFLADGMTREQAALLQNKSLTEADRVLAECQRQGIQILTMQDAAYPQRLRNIYDPPCLLYWKGTQFPSFDEEAAVAVVGTRTATPYGIREAEKLGYGLAKGGALVVTGLAKGIDAAAARGALRGGGRAVGILGNGIDVFYPASSRYLYEDVTATGALISEYPPGTEPAGRNFPVRNRILSGLCVATLVVEAPEKSGALITAGTALEQGRDVFAVPGPVDAEMSKGCNLLIRDGAGLTADAWDLLREYEGLYPGKLRREAARREPEILGYERRQQKPAKPAPETFSLSKAGLTLSDDQIAILRLLTEEPMQVDDVIDAAGLPARRVLSALTVLEIDNLVSQSSGKCFSRRVTLCE